MFHTLRESGAGQPAVMVRLLEVLADVASIERDPARRREIRRHGGFAAEAALRGTPDDAARADTTRRRDRAFAVLAAAPTRDVGGADERG